MAWTQSDIPDLDGRIAVVTGANGGLGLETAKALAGAGAHVVMAARNQAKAADAEQVIRDEYPEASLEIVELDLASLASVRTAADAIVGGHRVVDLLVNNAGLMAMPESTTDDGFEMQFGVNHLGHWAFTSHLLAPVLRAEKSRVVTVTSGARHFSRSVDPQNPHLRGKYKPWSAYGQAKVANFHFAIGLQHEFERAGVAAQSLLAHPGLSNTDLQSRAVREGGGGVLGPFFHRMAATTGMRPEVGVRPQLRAATDPEAEGGEFYGPMFGNNGAAVKRPILRQVGLHSAIEKLWDVSERETGVALDVVGTLARLDD